MAYRKTEKVLAQLEAKRSGLIAAAIDVIEKHGLDGLTTDLVAERAGVSAGLLYRYFPDKTELLAAAVAQCLERDLSAMREASNTVDDPTQALSHALAVIYWRMSSPRVMKALADSPAYRAGIRSELERQIKLVVDITPKARALAAAAAMGAIFGSHDVSEGSKKNEPAVVLMALRLIGVSDRDRKTVAVRYAGVSA